MKDFYIFSTRNPLTEIEKCGDASVRTIVAERGYTSPSRYLRASAEQNSDYLSAFHFGILMYFIHCSLSLKVSLVWLRNCVEISRAESPASSWAYAELSRRRVGGAELVAPNWHRRIGGAELSHFGRDMAVRIFPKCAVSRSVVGHLSLVVGHCLVVGPQYIHCSHVLLFATLGTKRVRSNKTRFLSLLGRPVR